MPKTLDTQGFSGLRKEVVRSQGRPSRTSIQQALITKDLFLFRQSSVSDGCLFFIPILSRMCYNNAERGVRMFLETERLILRKFVPDDFADFWEYANDPEMCRMMGRDDMSDPENARFTFDWLMNREERGYALVLRENNRVIGNLTVTSPPEFLEGQEALTGKRGCSMSFSISRKHQRKGLMEEALRAVIAHLFDTEGMDYINCGCFDFNKPSLALQAKLGFSHLMTEQFEQDGETITALEHILWKQT